MKAAFIAAIFAVFLLAGAAHTEEDTGCDVPAYLLTTENALTKVADSIKLRKQLDILVVGSGSSQLPGADGAAGSYPARLEKALKARYPNVTVRVTTDLLPKKTSEEVAEGLAQAIDKIPADSRPALTIWQTGTVDAIRAVDPDDFRAALNSGVETLQKAGTDVVLMNLQYSPRIESMLSVTPYLDTMRVVSQEHGAPLFDRFSIMRHWSDVGNFDLLGAVHGYAMAKRVHDCIGRALSTFIADASRVKPTDVGVQR
ncbi:MAG: SGNH/GDSL hydrolase family protein [Afipia sp.]|nr:SGNH/GDSL hydrolase family protein [Afipia sp.]